MVLLFEASVLGGQPTSRSKCSSLWRTVRRSARAAASQCLRHSHHFMPSQNHLTSWRHPKKGEYGIRYFEKERPHPHHFYYCILLQLFYFIIVVVNLLQCLIYKLKYITSTYGEKKQYISSLVLFAISGIHWGSWNVSRVEGLHDISQNNWTRKYFLPQSEKTRNALESQKIFLAGKEQAPGSDLHQLNTELVAGSRITGSLGSWGSIYRFDRIFL